MRCKVWLTPILLLSWKMSHRAPICSRNCGQEQGSQCFGNVYCRLYLVNRKCNGLCRRSGLADDQLVVIKCCAATPSKCTGQARRGRHVMIHVITVHSSPESSERRRTLRLHRACLRSIVTGNSCSLACEPALMLQLNLNLTGLPESAIMSVRHVAEGCLQEKMHVDQSSASTNT